MYRSSFQRTPWCRLMLEDKELPPNLFFAKRGEHIEISHWPTRTGCEILGVFHSRNFSHGRLVRTKTASLREVFPAHRAYGFSPAIVGREKYLLGEIWNISLVLFMSASVCVRLWPIYFKWSSQKNLIFQGSWFSGTDGSNGRQAFYRAFVFTNTAAHALF